MKRAIAKKSDGLEKWIYRASRWLNVGACIVLGFLTILTLSEVVLRYFGHPIKGALDLTQMFMVGIAFFALAHTQVHDNHVKADMIYNKFPKKFQGIADYFNLAVGVVVWAFIFWRLIAYADYMNRVNFYLHQLEIPRYPFVYPAALGALMLLLVLIIHFIKGRPKKTKIDGESV